MPSTYLKFSDVMEKHKGDLWLAGVGDGHTIYQKSNGEMFYIDTKTGDMKEVSADAFHKGESKEKKTNAYHKMEYIKFDGIKGESKVKLLGVDANGDVVHQKPNGEKFIVDEATGHVTVLK
jgi:outer membrane protein assembly factor BamB